MPELLDTYEILPEQERAFFQTPPTSQGNTVSLHTKEELVEAHFRNLGLLQASKPSTKQFILPSAYSPSASSLDSLQKISFNELKIETHHRGYFITAKTITPPYESTESVTIIEEENGNVAKLVLGFQDESSDGRGSSLPINSTVAVKEPYCKFNGEGDYVIRVDHPSDIAVLRGDDPAVSLIMQFVSEGKEVTPMQWKVAGDKAYLEKNYASAIECYTQAIDTSPTENQVFIQEMRRKRAYANLTARVFMAAKEDALASCLGDSLDEKAFFCAGRAAYELGAFSESKEHFQKAMKLGLKDFKTKRELKRVNTRILEQEEGIYDFEAMVASVTEQHIHLDHADFTKNAVVKSAGAHGRGIFAAKDLEPGSLVICEKSFCLPNRYTGEQGSDFVMYNLNTSSRTQRPAQSALFLQLVQKLYNNPHLDKEFFELDGGSYLRSGKEGELVDGVPIIDTFLVEAIRLTNCFSCPLLTLSLLKSHQTAQDTALSTGLWRRASYINHSCAPNCTRAFIGDMMLIRASCHIPAGTELTQQYSTPDEHFTIRRDYFKAHWDFVCDCRLCTSESKSPQALHEKRNELTARIKVEVLKQDAKTASRIAAKVKTVERLTHSLEALHEPQIYASLPRLLLIHPTIWLTETHRSLGNAAKTLKYAFEVLRNFGFVDVCIGEKVELDYGKGLVNSEAFNALRYASEACAVLGRTDLAKSCEQKARGMYVLLTGCEVGVEEMFSSFDGGKIIR